MAYEKDLFYYVKRKDGLEYMLDYGRTYTKEGVEIIKRIGKEKALEDLKTRESKEEIVRKYNEWCKNGNNFYQMLLDEKEIEIIEPVFVYKKSKWVNGDYYAHEYNKTVVGRVRRVVFTNGYQQFEIECLDNNLYVSDGMWDYPDSNGMGDTMAYYEKIPEIKMPK